MVKYICWNCGNKYKFWSDEDTAKCYCYKCRTTYRSNGIQIERVECGEHTCDYCFALGNDKENDDEWNVTPIGLFARATHIKNTLLCVMFILLHAYYFVYLAPGKFYITMLLQMYMVFKYTKSLATDIAPTSSVCLLSVPFLLMAVKFTS